jgi:predicted phosphate transport protein (TIGR00153 family)
MLIFKKEKAVIELVVRHIEKTRECVQAATEGLKAYVVGEYAESRNSISDVNRLESEADTLLRDILEMLYSGAYLPQIRGDIFGLMSTVDDINNKSENCYDFFHYQRPEIPKEYEEELIALFELTLECFHSFEKALKAYFGPKDKLNKVHKHSKRVRELESQADDIKRTMTARIFKSSMDKGEKIHLHNGLRKITNISDAIEDAADRLEWVSVKSIV